MLAKVAGRLCVHASLIVVATGLLPSSQAEAQADTDTIHLRNDCRLARQVLETGHPAPQRREAMLTIARCGLEAAPTLAVVWNNPPVGRGDLQLLVTSTRAIATPELVQTLLGAVQRTDLSTEQRVAALIVLITYADSTVVPPFRFFIGPPNVLLRQHYGGVDHPYTAVGRDQLPVPVRLQLRPILEQLAVRDPNPQIQIAAQVALANSPFQ